MRRRMRGFGWSRARRRLLGGLDKDALRAGVCCGWDGSLCCKTTVSHISAPFNVLERITENKQCRALVRPAGSRQQARR